MYKFTNEHVIEFDIDIESLRQELKYKLDFLVSLDLWYHDGSTLIKTPIDLPKRYEHKTLVLCDADHAYYVDSTKGVDCLYAFKNKTISESYKPDEILGNDFKEIIAIAKPELLRPFVQLASKVHLSVYQPDQMSSKALYSKFINSIQSLGLFGDTNGQNLKVYDSSKYNIEQYDESFSKELLSIESPEKKTLKMLFAKTPKQFDFAFVVPRGPATEKQLSKIAEIKRMAYTVLIINELGHKRDQEIARCSAYLSINKNEDETVFDCCACTRLLGLMPVYSDALYDVAPSVEPLKNINKKLILLFTSYFKSSNAERQKEYEYCLKDNLKNSVIDKVYVISEDHNALDALPETDKLIKIKVASRPTFSVFLGYMQEFTSDKDYSILANSDIIFDDSLLKIKKLLQDKLKALCLSRWDLQPNQTLMPYEHSDSQDTWIFKGKPKSITADFCLGILGCDNHFAWLLKNAGYSISNPMHDIITTHVHKSNFRTYTRANIVHGPYEKLPIVKKQLNLPMLTYKDKNELELRPRKPWIPKRVLHIGINQFDQVFKENSLWYKFVPTRTPNFKQVVLKEIKDNKPDLVFAQIQQEGPLTADFAKQIKANGPILINWTGDVRSPLPRWFYDVGHHVDLTLFSSITDAQDMASKGYKADFLQIGYIEKLYRPLGMPKSGIVFLGNNYSSHFPLSDFRFTMATLVKKEFKDLFRVYGTNWPGHFKAGNLNNNFEEEARVLATAEIVISVSHFNYSRYFSDRLLRALGSGALVLSHDYTDIGKDFIDGQHLVTFKNEYDLLDKIRYFLMNKAEAAKIAEAGQRFCLENCTNRVRLDELEHYL